MRIFIQRCDVNRRIAVFTVLAAHGCFIAAAVGVVFTAAFAAPEFSPQPADEGNNHQHQYDVKQHAEDIGHPAHAAPAKETAQHTAQKHAACQQANIAHGTAPAG